MAGDLPPATGSGPAAGAPGSTQWSPGFPTQPPPRPRAWPAIALATVATAAAIAALVVALTRPTATKPTMTTTAPSYSAAQVSAAQQKLCETYNTEARTVRADTNGNDEALARIAATNGAVMLYNAAADPALGAKYRDAARALATAYGNVSAMGSKGVASDSEWRAVLDEANAKDASMKQICNGG
nr:hypothetical protein [Mycobacterium colombiense]